MVVTCATCWPSELGGDGSVTPIRIRTSTTRPAHAKPASHLVDERNSGSRFRNPHPLLARRTIASAPTPKAIPPRDSAEVIPVTTKRKISRYPRTARTIFQGVRLRKPGSWLKKAADFGGPAERVGGATDFQNLPSQRHLPSADSVEIHFWPSQ